MARTPRIDALEARVETVEETVAKLEEIVIPPPVDPVDIPDPDGTTPRQKWKKGVAEVIAGALEKGETIDEDEANKRLINLLNNMQKPAGEI